MADINPPPLNCPSLPPAATPMAISNPFSGMKLDVTVISAVIAVIVIAGVGIYIYSTR